MKYAGVKLKLSSLHANSTRPRVQVPTPTELANKKLEKLHGEWDKTRNQLPQPYVRSEYGCLCVDCGAIWEPRGAVKCPACASEVNMPLKMLDLKPRLVLPTADTVEGNDK